MTNRFGIALHPDDARWAAAEGVSETVIAAVLLLHERSVDKIVAELGDRELEQVIKLVGRCPSCYPPGTLAALKGKRHLPARPKATAFPTEATTEKIAGYANAVNEDLSRTYRPVGPRAVNVEKPGTRPGTRAEIARRRMIVEDLRKAGLSVRAISIGTGIPVGSVHRAMRAIARAEAKREIAILEITNELLGKRLRLGR